MARNPKIYRNAIRLIARAFPVFLQLAFDSLATEKLQRIYRMLAK